MKIVIVDDYEASAAEVRNMLTTFFPQFTICGIYDTMNEAIEGINRHKPELVFLDVELSEGETGFDLLEKINPRFFEVIFITAYDKFAARAFQFSALHYLQKPIDEKLFVQAVNRAIETKRTKDFEKRFDILLNGMRTDYEAPQKIVVPDLKGEGWLCLDINQIIRLVSYGKEMVKIIYKEGDKYLYTGIKKSIGETEKMFEGHDFVRVHESNLVNLKYIESIKRDRKTLVMTDKGEVEISRNNVKILMEKMKKL